MSRFQYPGDHFALQSSLLNKEHWRQWQINSNWVALFANKSFTLKVNLSGSIGTVFLFISPAILYYPINVTHKKTICSSMFLYSAESMNNLNSIDCQRILSYNIYFWISQFLSTQYSYGWQWLIVVYKFGLRRLVTNKSTEK